MTIKAQILKIESLDMKQKLLVIDLDSSNLERYNISVKHENFDSKKFTIGSTHDLKVKTFISNNQLFLSLDR